MLLLLYLYFGLLYQYRSENKSIPSAWFLYLILQYNSHQCCFRCKRCLFWFCAFLAEFCWRFSAKQVLQFPCHCHCTSALYPYFIHIPLANRILVTGSIIKWNTYSVFLQRFQVQPEEYITVVFLHLPHYVPYLTLYFISTLKGHTCCMPLVWSPLSRGWHHGCYKKPAPQIFDIPVLAFYILAFYWTNL